MLSGSGFPPSSRNGFGLPGQLQKRHTAIIATASTTRNPDTTMNPITSFPVLVFAGWQQQNFRRLGCRAPWEQFFEAAARAVRRRVVGRRLVCAQEDQQEWPRWRGRREPISRDDGLTHFGSFSMAMLAMLAAGADFDDVAVLEDFRGADEADEVPGFGDFEVANGHERLVGDDFGADKGLGQLGVNRAGRVAGAGAGADRPGADFVFAHREERHQADVAVDDAGEALDAALFEPVFLEKDLAFGFVELADFGLNQAGQLDGREPVLLALLLDGTRGPGRTWR